MLPGFETEGDRRGDEADHDDREDSPTPGPLAAALLEAALEGPASPRWHYCRSSARRTVLRVIDVDAGYGVWSQRLRARASRSAQRVHITGVELNPDRQRHLYKWCDVVVIGDSAATYTNGAWDLAISNPRFTALAPTEDPADSLPAQLLAVCTAVLLYHSVNAFQRGPNGRAAARAYPPVARWLVPGTVSHDGTSSVASDCYALSLWMKGHTGPTQSILLNVDPEDANRAAGLLKANGEPYRCWRWRGLPPGSEEPSAELPGVDRTRAPC